MLLLLGQLNTRYRLRPTYISTTESGICSPGAVFLESVCFGPSAATDPLCTVRVCGCPEARYSSNFPFGFCSSQPPNHPPILFSAHTKYGFFVRHVAHGNWYTM